MTSITSIIKSKNVRDMLKNLIELTLLILISTMLTRYLWNSSLVKHITILSPIGSIKDALLLVIALNVLKSSCTCAQI